MSTAAEEEVAILKLPDGQEHKIKILKPSYGADQFLDIRDLHAKTGYFVFDPGFTCTGSCMSAITFIDGPKGVCLYRGYPVQELVEHASALQVAYLLLVGEMPKEEQRRKFMVEVKKHMLVHEKIKAMFANFTMNAHPMAIMVAVIGALSSIFSELDPSNAHHRWLACTRLIAKVPVLACMAYKTSIGQPIMYPRADLTFAENFLYMMFATPMEEYKVNKVAAKAINAFMILHMDHEQNASTSTVRIAGSSQANPYACIAAGVASLWGPAHGGANEAVIKMLEQIGTKENVEQFVADVKAKKEGVRLMGFGHRVYKNYDPRAKVMKKLVAEVLEELGVDDPMLGVAQELEKVALQDEYFIKRKLYPNVDYYSGIMLRAIGIPTSMFTVMFAMSRTVGWVSQWNEMVSEGQMRIGRPRQLYVGAKQREYELARQVSPGADDSPDGDFSKVQAMKTDLPRRASSFKVEVPDVSTR
eukprot:CAMPEP_0197626932 /NCGR_PEP_ID=MMETSP1338-20131121/5692_1 /TAXON_ID=43686 ORGANISM="Pelagodinium beii, Strain RCC1491" /NCGR_SAMPLE_ID=MMETSP1338 /ASSEMBLY_ACC=CAM_ASM_000754 /LENGTH=472 /DNA_ID=CAMNT_0043197529 /DNA_START=17 /DNA_END=1435 /DNA_ORIENTATION=+